MTRILTPTRLREHILLGHTYHDIATIHGITPTQVKRRATALGVTVTSVLGRHRSGSTRKLPPAADLHALAKAGRSDADIAKTFGVTTRAVEKAFRREGYHREFGSWERVRACLQCDGEFNSRGVANRVCDACRERNSEWAP